MSNIQRTVGKFPSQQIAEEAQNALQSAGFSAEQISVEAQQEEMTPTPQISQSQAIKSAKGGAIAGTVFGSLAGFILSRGAFNFFSAGPDVSSDLLTLTIGVTLAGAGVGAAAFALIAALSGVNAPTEEGMTNPQSIAQNYLIEIRGSEDEIEKAKEILRQHEGKAIS